jgi:CheY-like chemotaxis protein
MKYHLQEKGISIEVTGSPGEALTWATNGEIDILVVDMRMPEHGLSLAEKVHRVSDVEVVMLTGFAPTAAEKQWSRRLGVVVYSKDSWDDLANYVAQAGCSYDAREARELRRRLRILEYVHEEWVEDLVSKLQQIPELDKAFISSTEGPFTIAELIDDIRNVRPRGIEYIRLWRRALGTLLGLRRGQ